MDRDEQLRLYGIVADRLKEAHARVRALQVPEDLRMALSRKVLVITAAAKHDLADAARRLDRLVADLDAVDPVEAADPPPGSDGSPGRSNPLRHKGD